MESWVFLLVGGLGAVGAALSLGTLAALVQFRRTGELPGTTDDPSQPTEPMQPAARTEPTEPGTARRLWVRIATGAVVAAICFVILAREGLLGGPVLG